MAQTTVLEQSVFPLSSGFCGRGDALTRLRRGYFLAHEMEFSTIQQLPGDLLPGVESDGGGQRQRKINVEPGLLLSASDGLNFERIFCGRRHFFLFFHSLGYSLALMNTQAFSSTPLSQAFLFEDLGSRKVTVDFSGGHLSSDGGLLLLRQLDASLGLTRSLAACFVDRRTQRFVEHSLPELLAQRVLGLAAGYEDLNDHDTLRRDPLMAVVAGKEDPLGLDRHCERDKGNALASDSTLNRLELGNSKKSGAHKIQADHKKIEALLVQKGVGTLAKNTREVVIDLDATDNPIHGSQEGRFFHGHYGNYCYLPLYGFIGEVPVWAELRTSDRDASTGSLRALQAIVAAVRRRCPRARIIVRGDSGFCREELMLWCEAQAPQVYYCFGLAGNSRLLRELEEAFFLMRAKACLVGGVTRTFREFEYCTLESWSRARRVIGKAEVLHDKNNARYIVTNLPAEGFAGDEQGRFEADSLYENFYCARGNMENQIKQQLMDLHADRTSTHFMASNQLRLWLSTFAYFLLERLRTLALQGTVLERATAGTIRLRLLKIGALITVSVRRVYVRLASGFALQDVFEKAARALRRLALNPAPA